MSSGVARSPCDGVYFDRSLPLDEVAGCGSRAAAVGLAR